MPVTNHHSHVALEHLISPASAESLGNSPRPALIYSAREAVRPVQNMRLLRWPAALVPAHSERHSGVTPAGEVGRA
jgi:hypothetical protein